jgi:Putative MetA-pathway of phenol degradation
MPDGKYLRVFIMLNKLFPLTACLVIGLLSLDASASCGASFCPVNTDWSAQGVWADTGARLDLRYEHINQNQLRSGSGKAVAQQVPGEPDEIETRNRNWVAALDYNLDPSWGVSLSLPFVKRDHSHTLNDPAGSIVEQWRFNKLGDARLLGRYQLPSASKNDYGQTGLIFGLKLPTGSIDVKNAEGVLAERALQPGSGTTDLVLGGYYRYSMPAENDSWFTQLLFQSALNQRDNFKPGQRWNLDAGYRYQATDNLGLMLQMNYNIRSRDSGSNAEPDVSGSRVLSLSPGLSYTFARDWQAYGFVQKPLYQHVNGIQLTSDWSAVLGVSTKF